MNLKSHLVYKHFLFIIALSKTCLLPITSKNDIYFHPACNFLQLYDIQLSLYITRRYYIIITPICGMPNARNNISLWKVCTLMMMAWSCVTRRVLRIVLSNTYFVVFLYCLSSSCAPYVASFSGLFMFYCSFGIVFFLFIFFILEPLFMSTMRINHVFELPTKACLIREMSIYEQ